MALALLVSPGSGFAPPLEPAVFPWPLSALRGRMVELSSGSGGGALTLASLWVSEAQGGGETAVWLAPSGSLPFAPDLVENGVCLERLLCVEVADAKAGALCADELLRRQSAGFLVWDNVLHPQAAALSLAQHARLSALLLKNQSTLLVLTRKAEDAFAVSPSVSLRIHVERKQQTLHCRALKDKRWGPGLQHSEVGRVPPGMR